MSKFKNNMPSINVAATQTVEKHKDATKNLAGGLAFNINDSATKLLTMTGGQFFNEPSYHVANKVGTDGLSPMAREVVEVAKAVTGTDKPNDLLSIAHYLRAEKNIRTTPAVLYAIAAGQEQNRDRMVEYGPKVLRRPDEVQQAFQAYFALYGTFELENNRVVRKATLPNSFKKGLSAAIAAFDEYQLLKYEASEWPRWKDILQVVERKANFPVNKALLTYFITGEVSDPVATPILAARKELNALEKWNSNVPALAKKAHVQWDQLLSKFGNNKDTWEALIKGGKATLPVMAAVRNLRNMEQAGISRESWDGVRKIVLGNEDNKMMPFRFISARKNVTSNEAKSIADLLLDESVKNLPKLEGGSLVMADYSGSMSVPVSAKSEMTKRETAGALAAVIAKASPRDTVVGTFGSSWAVAEFSETDSAYRIFEQMETIGQRTGHSTLAHLAVDWLIQNRVKVARIFLLSDMQCYSMSSVKNSLAASLAVYKAKINPDVKLISVDLGGHGTSQVAADDKNVYLTSGFTEGIVAEVAVWEAGLANTSNDEVVSTTPSMDFVRVNF